jgi:uncharacterized protein
MSWYIRLVIRHRVAFLIAIAIITAVAASQFRHLTIATSLGTLFLGENPEYAKYKARVADFGGDGFIALAFEESDLFSLETIRRLKKALENIEALPDVDRVESIVNAGRIVGDNTSIEVSRYLDEALENPDRIPELKADLLADDVARGTLISSDGRHISMLVQLVFNETRPVETGPALIDSVLAQLSDAGFNAKEVHVAGIIPVLAEVIDQTFYNLTRITPIVLIILLVAVWLMFRRLRPVFITGLVGAISVLWTMGFAVTIEPRLSVLAAMAPAVVLIISFSDVIHLCSSYLLELAAGETKEKAILKSGEEVGKACLFTSLTTFAGFISLSLVPAPAFRLLGLVLGFGVGAALLLAMTLAPILFSLLPTPTSWRKGTTAKVQDGLDLFLDQARRLSTGHPWLTISVFAVLMAISIYGSSQIFLDTSFSDRLDENNKVQQDQRYFEEHFEGTSTFEIYIRTQQKEGLLNPELFTAIAEFESQVEQIEGVDRVVSLVDIIQTVHDELAPADYPAAFPETRPLLAQYMLLLEMSADDYSLDRLVDFERKTLRMLVRIPEQGVRETYAIGQQAMTFGDEIAAAGGEIQTTGSLYLMGGWVGEIITGQLDGLLTALISIGILMALGLWSWRIGLWSMIPNLFPLLALGGVLGLAYGTVDTDAIALAMIAVGIGVDDTIHFLMRYRLASARTNDRSEALRETFHFSGRAIVITSIVLIAGFLPFATSDYFPLYIMGTMLPLCLAVALLADLLLVPAMATVGLIRFPMKG